MFSKRRLLTTFSCTFFLEKSALIMMCYSHPPYGNDEGWQFPSQKSFVRSLNTAQLSPLSRPVHTFFCAAFSADICGHVFMDTCATSTGNPHPPPQLRPGPSAGTASLREAPRTPQLMCRQHIAVVRCPPPRPGRAAAPPSTFCVLFFFGWSEFLPRRPKRNTHFSAFWLDQV